MAISTIDGVVAALPGQICPFTKASLTSVAGAYLSLWTAAGQPGAGAASAGSTTTGAIPTSATAGALSFTNPGSGNSYVGKAFASSSVQGTVVIYDRLWHGGAYTSASGSISASTTTAVDRDSTGAGAELWVEIATALSAVATTITVTYVNQAGTGSKTATCAVPASAILGRMFPFVLAAGDTGIRQITAISGSAAPTGTFNLVILRRLIELPLSIAGVAAGGDFAYLGMPRVYDSACIGLFMNTNTTSTGTLSGSQNIIQG